MGHTQTDSPPPLAPSGPLLISDPTRPGPPAAPHNLQRSLLARAASFPVCRGAPAEVAVTRTVGQVVTVDAAPAGHGHRDPISFFRVFPLSVLFFFSFSILKNKI